MTTTQATEAETAGSAIRREAPLVPPDAIAARALVTVIAIMTFLAAVTAGAAILIGEVSSGWRQDVAREISIQIKPVPGRNMEQDLRRAEEVARSTAGIGEIRALTKAESERLLEPWLGLGLDLSELPVPRLLVVRLSADATVDFVKLRSNLAEAVPGAALDDHRAWIERLSTMSRTVAAVAALILGLVLIAMALAVAFATRGAMAGSHEIIHVLHFVGAADSYIARQFQRHFLKLGLEGGLMGGGAAALVFVFAGVATSQIAGAGSDQIEALFGSFSLGLKGYTAILFISGSVAFLTGYTSRSVVLRQLQSLT